MACPRIRQCSQAKSHNQGAHSPRLYPNFQLHMCHSQFLKQFLTPSNPVRCCKIRIATNVNGGMGSQRSPRQWNQGKLKRNKATKEPSTLKQHTTLHHANQLLLHQSKTHPFKIFVKILARTFLLTVTKRTYTQVGRI